MNWILEHGESIYLGILGIGLSGIGLYVAIFHAIPKMIEILSR